LLELLELLDPPPDPLLDPLLELLDPPPDPLLPLPLPLLLPVFDGDPPDELLESDPPDEPEDAPEPDELSLEPAELADELPADVALEAERLSVL
jgi:hypothetical protein